jgi:hypothetical protein
VPEARLDEIGLDMILKPDAVRHGAP